MAEQDTSVSYQFTKAGNNLSAKALAGTIKIDFTRAELSTTNHFGESEADIAGLTELDGVTQTVDLKEVDVVDNDPSFVKIPVKIDETAAPEDYALLTIGLYCKPNDGDEVLYSICSLKDPIYIHKSSNNSTFNLNLNTLVGSSSNVVIKVDPAGMVTHADFDAMMKRVAFIDKANTFTEQQTLAGGAVDGKGNAIATTKNLADGDVETLTSAKEYADTKISGKADDSKVVHTADMRKPASDVAGIEEVNAKQDKLTITPADDSKVVHDNHDGTVQINGHNINPFDTVQKDYQPYGLDFNNYINSGNYRFDTVATINYPSMSTSPHYWQLIVFGDGNSVYQIATGNNIIAMRQFYKGNGWRSWMQVATQSDVTTAISTATANMVDSTKATNFTAGLQSNGQDVALANNTIARNPNTGVVSTPTDFTNLTVNGGKSVATSDDLKSIEDASWHTITGKNESLSSYICLYKKNNEEKYVDLILHGIMGTGKNAILNTPDTQTELLDLKDIVSAPKEVSGKIVCLSNVNGSGFVEISGTKLTFAWYSTVLSVGSRIESTNSSDDTPFLRVTFD
ncbi:pyocin knob domain-containing protein [Secundilactobacillus muriivasis]